MGWIRRNALFGIVLCLLVAGGLVLRHGLVKDSGQGAAGGFGIGGPFALIAGDGRPVTQGNWPGKLLLITFGYRFCPDVCPTNLQVMAAALDLLGPEAGQIQPLFITIDPERDTPEAMAGYVSLFHPRLVGLSGTPADIAAVAKTFRVYYRKVESGDPQAYSVDHSAHTYLTDDRGVVRTLFSHGTQPEKMAGGIREVLHR